MNSNKYSQCGKSDSVNRKRSLKIRLGYLLSKSASYLPSLYRKNAAWRSSCNFERLGEAIFMLRCYRNKKPHPTPRQCLCCSILWQSRTVGSVTWSQPPRVAADHRKYVGPWVKAMTGGGKEDEMRCKWYTNDFISQSRLYGGHVFALKRRMKMKLYVISFLILVAHLNLLQVNGGKLKLVLRCFVCLFSVYFLYWFPLDSGIHNTAFYSLVFRVS